MALAEAKVGHGYYGGHHVIARGIAGLLEGMTRHDTFSPFCFHFALSLVSSLDPKRESGRFWRPFTSSVAAEPFRV